MTCAAADVPSLPGRETLAMDTSAVVAGDDCDDPGSGLYGNAPKALSDQYFALCMASFCIKVAKQRA